MYVGCEYKKGVFMFKLYILTFIECLFIFSISCVVMCLLIIVYMLYYINLVVFKISVKFRSITLKCWTIINRWTIPRMKLCTKFKFHIVNTMEKEIDRRHSKSKNIIAPSKTNFTDI